MAGASSEPDTTTAPIGPGLVVLVVGPSGAGKDTVIRAARDRLAGETRYVFPRRVVTRAPNAAEDHDVLGPVDFEAQRARGAFALSWQAHGLCYGIPVQIDAAVRGRQSIVFNASRRVAPDARARYLNTGIVLIDAPLHVRAERLAARDRERPEDIAARLRARGRQFHSRRRRHCHR